MKTEDEQLEFSNQLSVLTEELGWLTELTPTNTVFYEMQLVLHKMDELRTNYMK